MKRMKYLGLYLPKETLLKESKRIQIDGETYRVHGLEESILWKWVYDQKQYIDSMQYLSSY